MGVNVAYTRVAVVMALLFVTLPFVVRAVQPVLLELDREMEQAAESLGASRSPCSGGSSSRTSRPRSSRERGLAFARAVGRVRLARPDHGEHPVQDGGGVGVHLLAGGERQPGRRLRGVGGAARRSRWWSCWSSDGSRRGRCAMRSRYALRFVALGYLALLLGIPVAARVLQRLPGRDRCRLGRGDDARGAARLLPHVRDGRGRRPAQHDLRRAGRARDRAPALPRARASERGDRPAVRGVAGGRRPGAAARLRDAATAGSATGSPSRASGSSSRPPG